MKKLIIIGAGGHGRVAADAAEKTGKYREISFLDDSDVKSALGYPVVGKTADIEKYIGECEFLVGIGNCETRRRVQQSIVSLGGKLACIIHPSAVIGKNAAVGAGTLVCAGAVINPGAVIGDGVIINTSSSVDHDCRIGDFCHISVGAHLAGTVSVGECTFVCAGAVVINNIDVCGGCTIGAGAVVVKSIAVPGTYIGVPAVLTRIKQVSLQ